MELLRCGSSGVLGNGLLGAGSSLDLGDLQLGELLTVTLKLVIALALLELVNKLLLTLELVDDLSSDLSLCELGRIRDDLLAVVQEDDGELDLGTGLALDLLDRKNIIGGDLILLAARCYDCVHCFLPFMHQLVQQPNIVAGES